VVRQNYNWQVLKETVVYLDSCIWDKSLRKHDSKESKRVLSFDNFCSKKILLLIISLKRISHLLIENACVDSWWIEKNTELELGKNWLRLIWQLYHWKTISLDKCLFGVMSQHKWNNLVAPFFCFSRICIFSFFQTAWLIMIRIRKLVVFS